MKLIIREVGNSAGVILPKEVVSRLGVAKGDALFLTATPDGYRLTPYDPEFERQLESAEKVLRKSRNTFRELAK